MKYDECRVILACNLFEYRTINGISQEELALRIGIEVKSYAKIERAEVYTNLKILDRISRETGMTPAQLLTPLYQNIPLASNQ
ncbi:helix-turn-helix domain-containing protein [Anaerotruncus colihominis]|uniref:Helix-turn-helix transcriptional regulator n=2 Tax=Anaerotruncus colihominis TaxID=169435 RepID=A0A845ST49_9FIRM|nr:helix-turn-helix transcriptional regulator [Anaerotruncus colihominis]NDO40249.1 helix-turn-helix transcriptional regulator [Anaerotruncus colihominis]